MATSDPGYDAGTYEVTELRIVDALVEAGLAATTGDMTAPLQAHEIARVIFRLVKPLADECDAERSSRQAWAAEAMRLSWIHEPHGAIALSDEIHPRACACISDEQATQLGPGFSRPECAVHPPEWQPGDPVHADEPAYGECSVCGTTWTPAGPDHCPECGGRAAGGVP